MSRKIEDLIPEMQTKAREFAGRMAEIGIPFMFTCTYRSQSDQDELWSHGRNGDARPKVTWTKKSKHTDRTAFDIAILNNGQPVWDVKVNVNENDLPDYQEAGQVGESIGLVWGGRFKNADCPHFELPKEG
jgi:peptidoglycan L-alanyl-D-glutamate endopeptidase CwlK